MLRTIPHDVRHALRLFARNPGFFAVSALTIALAIGGCTAVFSVVNGVLLRPLPYPEPEQIVAIAEEHPGSTSTLSGLLMSNHVYHAWTPAAKTITSAAAYNGRRFTVRVDAAGEPERLQGAAVTPSLFKVLRIGPAAGRVLEDADAAQSAAPVVMFGHQYWTSRLGADPSIIGRMVAIDGTQREVVGIAAEGFQFPGTAQVYVPYTVEQPKAGGIAIFAALARMAPGVTPDQVHAEATAVARATDRSFVADAVFGKGAAVEVRAERLSDRLTKPVRPALIVLSVGIALVLLIACANVTNMFLSRGIGRSREMAVRAALGAGRGRLVRQLLVESLLLSAIGGVAGILLGLALTGAVPALAPADFPRLTAIALDGRVMLVAVLLSMLAGTLSGLLPALRGSRAALAPAMRESDARTSTASSRARPVLLAAEAALAVVLLVGSILLARSFTRLLDVDPGYNPSNVLTANLVRVGEVPPQRLTAVVNAVLDRVRAMPGVEFAGAGNMTPFGGVTAISSFTIPGMTGPDGKPVQARALSHTVSAGYAEALGMRLREGRFPSASDMTSPVRAMVVNRAFAQTYFNDGRPVAGRRFKGMLGNDSTDFEIVGVAENVLPAALDGKPEPAIYITQGGEFDYGRASLLVRASGDPAALGPAVRAAAREIEPSAVAIDNIATLSSQVAASVGQPRFAASVLGAFAALALLLAATGIYGVLSYNVSTRRREIGVRAALGASRWDLVRVVLAQGLGVTVIGLAAGMAAASMLTRLMENQLFGITALDPVSFIAGPAVLFLFAVLACAIPARRATRIDPAEALRAE